MPYHEEVLVLEARFEQNVLGVDFYQQRHNLKMVLVWNN